MIRTVKEVRLDFYNRISGKDALCHGFLKSFFNCGEEVFGDRAAKNGFGKLKLVLVAGSEFDLDVTVLTVTAGLLLVFAFDLSLFLDCFSVRDLR